MTHVQVYANKLENLEEKYNTYKVSTVNHEDVENLKEK